MTLPLAIGIDFGGTSIKPAVLQGGTIVLRGRALDTQALGSPEAIIDAMVEEIQRLQAEVPGVTAIGVGLPGMVDAINGIVHDLSNVPGWHEIALRDQLQERTGLPTQIDNDAKAMAYGEWRYGAANNLPNVICVSLGTGVGGGLILNGQLFRGSRNGAGEIGQTSIDHDGVPGPHGNWGALERYVGNRQIAERAQARYAKAGTAKTLDECSPKALSAAAAQNCPVALAVWEEVGTLIGAGLSNIIWLLNPDCIVIGGGVAKAGALLFNPIRAAICERTMPVFTDHLSIVPATLGSDAGVIGAAALAVESNRE